MSAMPCVDLEPAEADRIFFHKSYVTIAKALCGRCPLAEACLDLAVKAEGQDPAGYRFGIYGATTGVERAAAVGASTYVTGKDSPGRAARRREARAAQKAATA